MRISTELLREVDIMAGKVGVSRNEMINQMITYALANIDEKLD